MIRTRVPIILSCWCIYWVTLCCPLISFWNWPDGLSISLSCGLCLWKSNLSFPPLDCMGLSNCCCHSLQMGSNMAHATYAGRGGMLQIQSVKEFQLVRYRRRAFSAVAPSLWNIVPPPPSPPPPVRSAPNLLVFWTGLKSWLYQVSCGPKGWCHYGVVNGDGTSSPWALCALPSHFDDC